MMTSERKPPPRPYTEYNIFFQIEREYILQGLGVIPDLKPTEVFSASDERYDGPELPTRYKGLILPADWYVPGKGRRNKRQHRASHGMISFTDLSKNVSSAWRSIDAETKLFCAQLADVGNQKYKKELQQHKLMLKRSSSITEDSGKRPSTVSEDSNTKPAAVQRPSGDINPNLELRRKSDQSSSLTAQFGFFGGHPAWNRGSSATSTSTVPDYGTVISSNNAYASASRNIAQDPSIPPFSPTSHSSRDPTTSVQDSNINPRERSNSAADGLCIRRSDSETRERSESCVDLPDSDILDMWKTTRGSGSDL